MDNFESSSSRWTFPTHLDGFLCWDTIHLSTCPFATRMSRQAAGLWFAAFSHMSSPPTSPAMKSCSKAKATEMEQEQQCLVITSHGGCQSPETRSELPLPNFNPLLLLFGLQTSLVVLLQPVNHQDKLRCHITGPRRKMEEWNKYPPHPFLPP